jgi:hypothetical protein
MHEERMSQNEKYEYDMIAMPEGLKKNGESVTCILIIGVSGSTLVHVFSAHERLV